MFLFILTDCFIFVIANYLPPKVVFSDELCPPLESAPFPVVENFIMWPMVKLPTLPKAELSKQYLHFK